MSLSEKMLNSDIYVGSYFATGEGMAYFILYNKDNSEELLKKVEPYFARCLVKMTIKELLESDSELATVQTHAPFLYKIIKGEVAEPGYLNVDVKLHFNYS